PAHRGGGDPVAAHLRGRDAGPAADRPACDGRARRHLRTPGRQRGAGHRATDPAGRRSAGGPSAADHDDVQPPRRRDAVAWAAAERLCSRGDWAIFLYQLRQHCPRAGARLEALMDPLVNERPLTSQQTRDLREVLRAARDELSAKPATEARANQVFASAEDLEAMIAAARARLGQEPTLADVWADLFSRIDPLLV